MPVRDITHPDDSAAHTEAMRAMTAGEMDTFTQEKRYLRPNGQTVWVDLSVVLMRDAGGEPLYFIPRWRTSTSDARPSRRWFSPSSVSGRYSICQRRRHLGRFRRAGSFLERERPRRSSPTAARRRWDSR